jgi:hypothetical protein
MIRPTARPVQSAAAPASTVTEGAPPSAVSLDRWARAAERQADSLARLVTILDRLERTLVSPLLVRVIEIPVSSTDDAKPTETEAGNHEDH